MSLPSAVAGVAIWLRREYKAHFGLPWVRPWDNRGKCYMDLKRIQCLSNASQHVPIYLQPFPSNSSRKFKRSHFSTFLQFLPPWVRPWDNRGKCYMDRKRIQCWSNASQHVCIYLQPFTSYSDILVGNCNFFLPLALNASVGDVPIGIPGKNLVLIKLESWELPGSEDRLTIG